MTPETRLFNLLKDMPGIAAKNIGADAAKRLDDAKASLAIYTREGGTNGVESFTGTEFMTEEFSVTFLAPTNGTATTLGEQFLSAVGSTGGFDIIDGPDVKWDDKLKRYAAAFTVEIAKV